MHKIYYRYSSFQIILKVLIVTNRYPLNIRKNENVLFKYSWTKNKKMKKKWSHFPPPILKPIPANSRADSILYMVPWTLLCDAMKTVSDVFRNESKIVLRRKGFAWNILFDSFRFVYSSKLSILSVSIPHKE